jgi:hypothetical protein
MNSNESNLVEDLNKSETNDELNIPESIEKYGILISNSLDVDNKPLVDCLDKILEVLKGYLVLIFKVNFRFLLNTFVTFI